MTATGLLSTSINSIYVVVAIIITASLVISVGEVIISA